MLSIVTLDDKDGTPVTLHDATTSAKRGAVEAHGFIGGVIADLRQDKQVRPQVHGSINRTTFQNGAAPYLTLEIVGDTVEDAYDEWLEIAATLQQTLDYGPALLKWTEAETGRELQRLVKLDSMVDPPLAGAASILTFPVTMFAEDPRAYSQTLETDASIALSAAGGGLTFPLTFPFTFSYSGGGTVTVVNDGSQPTPPVFRIYGLTVGAQIVNVGNTAQRIVFDASATIPSGSYVEIDTWARTMLLNGTEDVGNLRDSETTTWFDLPPGTTNLQLVASSFDGSARLDVLYRHAY